MPDANKENNNIQSNWMSGLALLVGIGIIGAAIVIAFFTGESTVNTCLVAGVILLILSKWPSIKRLEWMGGKIETVHERLEEAEQKLDRILLPIATMLFGLVARQNRFAMISRSDQLSLINEIEERLKEAGARPEEIGKAKEDWHRFNTIDMAQPVVEALKKQINTNEQKIQSAISGLGQPIEGDKYEEFAQLARKLNDHRKGIGALNDYWKLPDYRTIPQFLRNFDPERNWLTLEQRGAILTEQQECMLDLDEYVLNESFRRLDVWLHNAEDE